MSTAARADEMCCSAQASSVKGTALYVTASTTKCRHWARSDRGGSAVRRARSTTSRTPAPRATRRHATVAGVIPRTATLMNRNDHPQMKARTIRRRTRRV